MPTLSERLLYWADDLESISMFAKADTVREAAAVITAAEAWAQAERVRQRDDGDLADDASIKARLQIEIDACFATAALLALLPLP